MKLTALAALETARLEKENQSISSYLLNLPDGEIRFHKNQRHFRWRHVTEKPSSGLQFTSLYKNKPEDIELARQLCLKHYLQDKLTNNNEQLQALQEFIKNYSDNRHDPEMCGDYHTLLDSYFLQKRAMIEKWMNAPYEKNPNHPENLTFKANNGVYMRSKSEVLIANMFLERGIPFRYEQALYCGGVLYYPDFTILNPADMKTIILWEHFGRMDDPAYLYNNMGKLEAYTRKGFVYGKTLIATLESKAAPLTEETVELILNEMFGDVTILLP